MTRPIAGWLLPPGGVDGILTTLTERIDAEVLEGGAAGRLRVVANIAVGADNIDVRRATQLGVAVCNTPGVLASTKKPRSAECVGRCGSSTEGLAPGGLK